MSLLIGIKQTHASGSYHGADGFEGFSMDGTVVTLIKEGNIEDLILFVDTQREIANTAKKEIDKINDELNYTFDMPDKKYNELGMKLHLHKSKTGILNYDKLMIIEGITI